MDLTAPHSTEQKALYIKPHTFKVEPDNTLRSGDATWARIIGTNGRAVADMDVSTKKGGKGWFAFNPVSFMKGGPVTVYARMAIFDERRRAEDEEV